jgi:hypothetical protein
MGSIPEFSILKGGRHPLPHGVDHLLHRLFERSAALFSEADASCPTHTFGQLDALSTKLARAMLQQMQQLQARPNSDGDYIVGVSLFLCSQFSPNVKNNKNLNSLNWLLYFSSSCQIFLKKKQQNLKQTF